MPESKLSFGNKESVLNNCITDTMRNRSLSAGLDSSNTSELLVEPTVMVMQKGLCIEGEAEQWGQRRWHATTQ